MRLSLPSGCALALALCAATISACGAEPRTERARVPIRAAPAEPLQATDAPATPSAQPPQAPSEATSASPAPAPERARAIPELDFERVDALVKAAISERKLPGCVIAVGRHDQVIALRAYGDRALVPARVPMTTDTIFDLASLSKAVATAPAIFQLIDRKQLELDAPIARYLPELDRPRTRAITVRQLLLHSSGLPHVNPLRDYAQGPEAGLRATLALEPEAPAGKRFEYSDLGYIWLGELVRRVSGEAIDRFSVAHSFGPLGMRETWYQPPAALLPRIAPTEITDLRGPGKVLIHGSVHDPRAYRLGGVAGNAGVFSTASDLARFAQMILGRGQREGVRVLSEHAIAELTRPQASGESQRTPGFDVHSFFSRLRGRRLSEQAFGHGGFTGTSLWIDPVRDLFVVFLSNRVHPDGTGNVIGLVGEITDAVVAELEQNAPCAALPSQARAGVDVLAERGFDRLQGKRIALVTHRAATARDGTPTLELLARAKNVKLTSVLSPEHGLDSGAEGAIANQRSAGAGALARVPVFSLFGAQRRPTAQMLNGADAVVVDLVDVGTRFYTYMSTLHEVLRAGAELKVPVIVLDRPNPIGDLVGGPVLDADVRTFVNHHPLPVVHGMTAGELAALIARDEQLSVVLEVIEAGHVRREALFEETGLTWRKPSPNLPNARSALLYPTIGLLESTNISVGRGTTRPFEQLGAPFIDAKGLLEELGKAQLPGVRFEATSFTPAASPYRGLRCHGVRLELTDPHAFRPVHTALVLARALIARHRDQWKAADMHKLLGHRRTLDALLAGADPSSLDGLWEPELSAFRTRRSQVLRYPRCAF